MKLIKKINSKLLIFDNIKLHQLIHKTISNSNSLSKQYIAFKERHRNKLIIFISHVEGKKPDGRSAKKVMFDATLKIWVEGFRAFSKGRYIGTKGCYTIWEKGANRYWQDNENDKTIITFLTSGK